MIPGPLQPAACKPSRSVWLMYKPTKGFHTATHPCRLLHGCLGAAAAAAAAAASLLPFPSAHPPFSWGPPLGGLHSYPYLHEDRPPLPSFCRCFLPCREGSGRRHCLRPRRCPLRPDIHHGAAGVGEGSQGVGREVQEVDLCVRVRVCVCVRG